MNRRDIRNTRLVLAGAMVSALFVVPARAQTVHFDFSGGDHGFVAGLADFTTYPPDYEEPAPLADVRPLPEHLGAENALYIAGNNPYDDLFMYFKKQIGGLVPNTPYQISYAIDFATEAAYDSAGIGGSPAHSVILKAGASPIEPVAVAMMDGIFREYRLNLDKGNQSQAGADALILGDISRAPGGPPDPFFELVSRNSGAGSLLTSSDAEGELWLFFGTDSGFEGVTQLYYTDVRATLTPIPEPGTLVIAAVALLTLGLGRALRHWSFVIRSSF